MGLENLKSVFSNIGENDYESNKYPKSIHDTVADNYPEGSLPPGP